MSRKPIDPTLATFTRPVAPRPWTGYLVTVLGLGLTAVGPLAVLGTSTLPEMQPLLDALGRWNVRPDVVSIGGLVLLAMGRLASYQHKQTRVLLEPGLVEHDLEQVDAGMRELQSRMKELRDEQALTRERLAGLARQISEQRDVSNAGHESAQNALFRLASSLDQLGANIEHVVRDGSHEMQSRVIENLQLTESSRDFLSESIEEMGRELAHYVYEVVTSLNGRPAGSMLSRAFMNTPPVEPEAQPEPAAPAEPEEFDASAYASAAGYDQIAEPEPLETESELEPGEGFEDLEALADEPKASEDEGEQEVEDHPDSPLGLLDHLENRGANADDPSEQAEATSLDVAATEQAPASTEPNGAPLQMAQPPALPTTPPAQAPGPAAPAAAPLQMSEPPPVHQEGPPAAPTSPDHQPLPNVLPALNPRDPRNITK